MLNIDIAYASINNAEKLAGLATGIKASDGSALIHWPADIPSNMDKYQLIFLNFANDSLINHSDSFILTGEIAPATVTETNRGGLSAGGKAAIGVLVPVVALMVLALVYYLLRRSTKQTAVQNALEKGYQKRRRAELEGDHRIRGFLHRFRTELKGSVSQDYHHDEKEMPLTEMPGETPCEMPAGCRQPVEMPTPTSYVVVPLARNAAFPCQMPCPEVSTLTSVIGDIDHRGDGGRPLSRAATMMAKATSGERCAEVQSVGSGFIVTRRPLGACRKEVPRHKATRSTTSATSSTMVSSKADFVDPKHDVEIGDENVVKNEESTSTSRRGSEIGNENEIGGEEPTPGSRQGSEIGDGNETETEIEIEIENGNGNGNGNGNENRNEQSTPRRNSTSAPDAKHESPNRNKQSITVSPNSELGTRHDDDDDYHVGNAAEDEMTREPEGDIF